MPGTERIRSETIFHDRQAQTRAASFDDGAAYHFDDDDWLDHETWIRSAFARLGDTRGLDVLDYGCGHGMAAVVLARRGAKVTAFDLSHGYVAEARKRAAANGVEVRFVRADAERLPFATASFDRVWGNAVLHHLDPQRAGGELRRVLCPGGRAVFCEPWGENRLLNWARASLPYPQKQRTADEKPLCQKDIEALRGIFPNVTVEGFQLLSMARRVIRQPHLRRGLDWCDRILLERAPAWQRYCRYIVVELAF